MVDADTCLWKPLVVTAGEDRTLKVWDYRQHVLLMSHPFKQDVFSLSVHPTGGCREGEEEEEGMKRRKKR